MDSDKITLNDGHPEHEAEFNEVLAELREAIFRRKPSDVYQFCATYFNVKLAEQREGLLELVKMHPTILDPTAPAAVGAAEGGAHARLGESEPRESGPEASDSHDSAYMAMQQASEHAWTNGGGGSVHGVINPAFSFGGGAHSVDESGAANMRVDDDSEDSEARDKFSSLVSVAAGGSVQPFAGRRFSVSAESMNPTTEAEYKKKFIPKTEGQKQRIDSALDSNFLFRDLDEDSHRDVVDAMEEKRVGRGQSVIVQGGVGDYFYIVERGTFDIHMRKGDEMVLVATASDGGSFGELALMYNAPRAATVTATSDATVWALDRITFRSLLMERTSRKRRLYERFLETVPLLKSLEAYERQKIADALESVAYSDGETIVEQGEPGSDFYLIEQGAIRVYKTDEDGVRREYPSLAQGGYFGELALLDDQPRQATLVSSGRTKCARMSKDAFDRLLGPVINIIRREAGNYMHIQSLTRETEI
ncbi:hypothetical protein GGF38_002084 [Coemansia sp. RSA 25]|nr:hypothetical protein GGF38_002084 [Coemansia sp. RSA 25]